MSPAVQTVLYVLFALLVVAGLCRALVFRPDLSPAALERDHADGTSHFTEVDGLRVHYRDEGSGDPIVLLHGLTDSLFVWDQWASQLSGYVRVIRLDLPGHGLTGPDPQGRYAWSEITDLVVEFLDQLGLARATLVGSSWGGAIAWQLAARFPERVDRLVLIAPVGYTASGQLPWLLWLLAHPVIGPLLARLTSKRSFMRRVRHIYADPMRVDRVQAERQYRLFRRAGNRDALSAILRGGGVLETEAPLARVRAPTLLLWGAADPVLPSTLAHCFARDIANAELVMIPGVGHAPMLELPEQSLAKLLGFLRCCSP
jgi:pimeloyl-ACP methyl ester carboxylesterase